MIHDIEAWTGADSAAMLLSCSSYAAMHLDRWRMCDDGADSLVQVGGHTQLAERGGGKVTARRG